MKRHRLNHLNPWAGRDSRPCETSRPGATTAPCRDSIDRAGYTGVYPVACFAENRGVGKWSSHLAHNQKIAGSSPAAAIDSATLRAAGVGIPSCEIPARIRECSAHNPVAMGAFKSRLKTLKTGMSRGACGRDDRSCEHTTRRVIRQRAAFSGVAQWKEQRVSNPQVDGSSPFPAIRSTIASRGMVATEIFAHAYGPEPVTTGETPRESRSTTQPPKEGRASRRRAPRRARRLCADARCGAHNPSCRRWECRHRRDAACVAPVFCHRMPWMHECSSGAVRAAPAG